MGKQAKALIEEMFMTEYEKFRAIACAILSDPPLAEDCVQKAFCVALEKEDELEGHPSPIAWMTVVVKYTALAEMKNRDTHNKRNVSWEWDIAGNERADSAVMKDDRNYTQILETLRSELKPEDYGLLMRSIEENVRGEDVAEEFGLSRNTYYKRMERIRKRVRKVLDMEKKKEKEKSKKIFLLMCQIFAFLAIYK